MMEKPIYKKSQVNSLFWKVSAIFLIVLVILASIYVVVSVRYSQLYYQEVNQRLNRSISEHIADDLPPFKDGKVNGTALKMLFKHTMILNPQLEIYLLDTGGKILSYSAPESKIHLQEIPLKVVDSFLGDTENRVFLGPDPRNIGVQKVFSAHPVYEEELLQGYIYVILASEEFESVASSILGSYVLRLSLRIMVISLVAAIIIGIIAIWYLTLSFREIMVVISRFHHGDFSARFRTPSRGNMGLIGQTFNDMADEVVSYVNRISSMEKLRRGLIANISHDLRTPLSTIQGYVETLLMKDEALPEEEKKRYLKTVLGGTKRLHNLVEDLFELSKLEANETPMNIEPFSITDLVQDNFARYQIFAQKKNIHLNASLPEGLPLVKGDIAYIDRVFQNLLDNAVKFSDKNGNVNIELEKCESTVEVRLSNEGPGISPEEIPHLFVAYQTGRRTKNGQTDSTGLGLAIVKKILERHGTDIRVTSQPGKTTSFMFHLPQAI